MKLPDASRVSEIIVTVAEAEIMPRFQNLCADQIREKGPGDLVTEADVEAERALSKALRALLPGSLVVGEEAVAADDTILDALGSSVPVWIIDPVDGTANFARGSEIFGVIIALALNGKTVAGWIYDPIRKRMAVAETGQGAWMNGERLACAKDKPLNEMKGNISTTRVPTSFLQALGSYSRSGSAAHDYIELASGRYDFTLYRRIKPWDHAAGVLLHAEAGGFTQLLDRRPYSLRPSKVGILSASSPGSWESLAAFIPDLAQAPSRK